MKSSRNLFIIVVLQSIVIAVLLFSSGPQASQAQISDPAAQRDRLLDQLVALNEKVATLNKAVTSGQVRVNVRPDEGE